MKCKINIKKLLLIIFCLVLAVAVVRGCIYAINGKSPITGELKFKLDFTALNENYIINVYNAKTNEVMKMGLEEYVFCVTAAEMPASYDSEALKAQAVAARTFAFTHLTQVFPETANACSKGKDCAICTDSTCCQAWRSIDSLRERWGTKFNTYAKKVYEAVLATAGQYIQYDGKPILALYHSVSGGITEDCQNVFSTNLPYLTSVDSPNEESASHYSDKLVISRDEAASALNKAFGEAQVISVNLDTQLKVLERFSFGRVKTMQVGNATCTGREFRKALELNSTNYTIAFDDHSIIVNTIGYGHGVGMSQAGANAMAQRGYLYDKIILHYYTGVSISNIQTLSTPVSCPSM